MNNANNTLTIHAAEQAWDAAKASRSYTAVEAAKEQWRLAIKAAAAGAAQCQCAECREFKEESDQRLRALRPIAMAPRWAGAR